MRKLLLFSTLYYSPDPDPAGGGNPAITDLVEKLNALTTKVAELEKTNKDLVEYNRSLLNVKTTPSTTPPKDDNALTEEEKIAVAKFMKGE